VLAQAVMAAVAAVPDLAVRLALRLLAFQIRAVAVAVAHIVQLVKVADQVLQLYVMQVLLDRLQLAALLTNTVVLVQYIGYIHLQHQAFFQCYLRLYRYIH
jgi:hypothetical protein